jgi:hypothetical protein
VKLVDCGVRNGEYRRDETKKVKSKKSKEKGGQKKIMAIDFSQG